MLAMIPVTCPHCGVHGQIILPPLGSFIIGPCPRCKERVMILYSPVLPLSKDIIDAGDTEQIAAHLQTVMMDYYRDKTRMAAEQLTPENLEGLHDYTSEDEDDQPPAPDGKKECPQEISMTEFEKFVNNDLLKIDEGDYFRKNIEGKK